jgi:hypothetical protein
MSQDLFAAFGVPESQDKQRIPAPSTNEDDDWGEFEGAKEDFSILVGPPVTQSSAVPVATRRYQYDLDDLNVPQVKPPVAPAGRLNIDLLSLDTEIQAPSAAIQANLFSKKQPKNLDVLFDASDEDGAGIDDLDDFGEFEDFDSPKPANVKAAVTSQPTPNIDLFGIEDDVPMPQQERITPKSEPTPFAFGQVAITTSHQMKQPLDFNSFAKADIVKPRAKMPVKEDKHGENPVEGEKWEDFEAWGEDEDKNFKSDTKSSSKTLSESKRSENVNLLGFANVNATNIDNPPTTIPPPAVIISIFPSIFDIIEKELLLPLTSHSQTLRRTVLSDSKTVAYLHGYLAVIQVLGHIIAGRKFRWKRDTILAQSMRIGPASAGRLSGMKVTSIDKSESNREDREVSEVLRAWNMQVGRLRGIVNEAKKLTDLYLPNIPELRETMPVKSASEADGGVSSAKPCALCGLKRNERVGKVDFEVEDSFGEWWDEKTLMHRGRWPLIIMETF